MSRSPQALVAMFAALCVPFWLGVQRFWIVCEDAFITFRYSKNLAEGFGPRFNTLPSEVPVEGYSNFLWMVIAAAVEYFDGDVTVVMPWLSAITGFMVLGLTLFIMDRRLELPPVATALAGLSMALFPPMTVWSTSGLASMPMTLFMLMTASLLLWGESRAAIIAAGVSALLLSLTRVEGVYWAITLFILAGVARRIQGRTFSDHLRVAGGILLLGYAPYFGWRAWYYQSLFANTVYVKVAMSGETIARGVQYTVYYFLLMGTPLLMLPAALAGWKHERRAQLSLFAIMGFAVPTWALLVSGDYMCFFRLMVPGIPFMTVMIGVLWAALWTRRARLAVPILGIGAAVVGTLPGFDVILVPDSVLSAVQTRLLPLDNVRQQLRRIGADAAIREGQLFGLPNGAKLTFLRNELSRWETMKEHADDRKRIGRVLRDELGPGARVVTGAIGVVGYYSGVYIYDQNGLVSREVARREADDKSQELRWPGHDSFVEKEFFLRKHPTVLSVQMIRPPRQGFRIRELANRYADEDQKLFYPQLLRLDRRAPPDEATYLLLQRMGASNQVDRGWAAFDRAANRVLIEERNHKREERKNQQPQEPKETEELDAEGRWRAPEGNSEVNLLQQIGYVAGSVEAEDRPIIDRYTPHKVDGGYNFLVSGHAPEASIIDMDGKTIHTWSRSFEEIWPNYPTGQLGENPDFWRRALLLPDGGVVAIFEGLGMARLDRDSELLWATPNRAHHDVRLHGSELVTLTRAADFVPEINEQRPIFEDFITFVDLETGTETRRISVPRAMLASKDPSWQDAENHRDPFHTNSVQVLDGTGSEKVPALSKGNVLISMRNIHTIAIIDPSSERLVWSHKGEFAKQHDARVLGNGHIMLLDNGVEPPSSVLELDPAANKTVWQFKGSDEEPFHTPTCGTAERLPNGNTLVVESDPGRAFELTADGTIVWEYNSPHRAGPRNAYVATLFQMERVPRHALRWLGER